MNKIGIWSGSSPTAKDTYVLGLKRCEELGHDLVVPTQTKRYATQKESSARPYLAGPDQAKTQALLTLWNNKDIHQIIGTRGGSGALRLLPLLDQMNFKKRRDLSLWGFSDFTTLQLYFYQRFQMPWVHSPFISSPAFLKPQGVESKYWTNKLESFNDYTLSVLHAPQTPKPVVKGPLLGGNFTCLMTLMGTPWEPRPKKPFYLFLEDINEAPYRVDRMLQQLSHSKFIQQCRGIVLGHFTDKTLVYKVFKLWAQEQNIWVVKGLPSGHDRPNCPISMGHDVKFLSFGSEKVLLSLPTPKLGC